MKHYLKYVWGLGISAAALPLVLICGLLQLGALALLGIIFALGHLVAFVYEGPLAPKAQDGESLSNPLSRLASWIAG